MSNLNIQEAVKTAITSRFGDYQEVIDDIKNIKIIASNDYADMLIIECEELEDFFVIDSISDPLLYQDAYNAYFNFTKNIVEACELYAKVHADELPKGFNKDNLCLAAIYYAAERSEAFRGCLNEMIEVSLDDVSIIDGVSYIIFEDGSLYFENNGECEVWVSEYDFALHVLNCYEGNFQDLESNPHDKALFERNNIEV